MAGLLLTVRLILAGILNDFFDLFDSCWFWYYRMDYGQVG